ncbi:MAG: hypothetical protein NVS3B10_16240 [Polyangiales bacterium]
MNAEVPRIATVERLLEAAEAEFAQRGFAQARLEDIAAAVGVRRASLLYHFESKHVLYEKVLERAFADFRALVVAALGRPATTYAERLDDVAGLSVDVFTRRPFFSRLILRDALDCHDEAVERAKASVQPLLELGDAIVRGGQAAGELGADLEPRSFLLFFTGAIIFHASIGDAQRDVLWGPSPTGGRGLQRYRDEVRAMVRRLALVTPALPERASDPEQTPPNSRRRPHGRTEVA